MAKKKTRKKVAKKRAAPKRGRAKKVTRKKAPAKRKVGKKAHQVRKRASSKKAPAKRKPAAKAAVIDITRHTEFSISQFALNTGFDRRTIAKRFAAARLRESRIVAGYPVYRVIDGMPLLYQVGDSSGDPDKMKPFDRRAFYQGELDKLKLQTEAGELVPSFEVEREMARLFKIVTQGLDTIPDTLERDVGATAIQLIHIEKALDKIREGIYHLVVKDTNAGGTAKARA